jgi:radical S-adenosyl methionine domain-containing protein 2
MVRPVGDNAMPIETVNLHIWGKCNLACSYCYGTFPARPRALGARGWCRILDVLAEARVRRVSFSGGEPTLHPGLLEMLDHAGARGLQTSIITNGIALSDGMLRQLDMVGMTLDAATPSILERLGRAMPSGADYLARLWDVNRRCRAFGVRMKINTVVTSINVHEELVDTLLHLRPAKWKPMQFVYVRGENDADAASLHVSSAAFHTFVRRHARVTESGIWVEPESATTVRTTYVMVDPAGRVFQHAPEGHRTSAPVLDVGLVRAIEQAGGYDRDAFLARGGDVDVRRLPVVQEGRR